MEGSRELSQKIIRLHERIVVGLLDIPSLTQDCKSLTLDRNGLVLPLNAPRYESQLLNPTHILFLTDRADELAEDVVARSTGLDYRTVFVGHHAWSRGDGRSGNGDRR